MLPHHLASNPSPLNWQTWEQMLGSHPDRCYANYITSGIRDGFRIGFNYSLHRCKKAANNMKSALEHPMVVRDYLQEETCQGRVIGPMIPGRWPDIHVSRFGVIPKKQSDRWRLILDLSAPEGWSVNDGIDPSSCTFSYISVDQAADVLSMKGQGSLMAKVDIKSAYRIVPIHPEDRHLLGMVWEDRLYVDTALPFGLRSAPIIFTAIADAIEWFARRNGVSNIFHYLDDYLIIGNPLSKQCESDLQSFQSILQWLKVPIAREKLEGPSTRLTFLGIELDTALMVRRLPSDKLHELKGVVAEWLGKKTCRRQELQSLVGKLQHACKVVRPGRTFLSRMFVLLKGLPKKQQLIRLNVAFRSDLLWWHLFLVRWNGISMLQAPPHAEEQIFSDAAGSYGCGVWWRTHWFQLKWPDNNNLHSIAIKELVPIVIACILWGKQWSGKAIQVHCDNQAVVEMVNSGHSKDMEISHLLRCLFFITAAFEITLVASHIQGKDNVKADAISRNNLSLFRLQAPEASQAGTVIPESIVELLIHQRPDWTSQSWCRLFTNSLLQV